MNATCVGCPYACVTNREMTILLFGCWWYRGVRARVYYVQYGVCCMGWVGERGEPSVLRGAHGWRRVCRAKSEMNLRVYVSAFNLRNTTRNKSRLHTFRFSRLDLLLHLEQLRLRHFQRLLNLLLELLHLCMQHNAFNLLLRKAPTHHTRVVRRLVSLHLVLHEHTQCRRCKWTWSDDGECAVTRLRVPG